MGYFSDKVHDLGTMAGHAARAVEGGMSKGFATARKVVHGAAKVGNTISRVVKKADAMTGGALGTIADAIPGGAMAKRALKTGLNLVNGADKVITSAEGAVRGVKKMVSSHGGKAMKALGSAAGKADSAASGIRKTIKKGTKMAKKAGNQIRKEGVAGIASRAVDAVRA